jgi:hypothetical protein
MVSLFSPPDLLPQHWLSSSVRSISLIHFLTVSSSSFCSHQFTLPVGLVTLNWPPVFSISRSIPVTCTVLCISTHLHACLLVRAYVYCVNCLWAIVVLPVIVVFALIGDNNSNWWCTIDWSIHRAHHTSFGSVAQNMNTQTELHSNSLPVVHLYWGWMLLFKWR